MSSPFCKLRRRVIAAFLMVVAQLAVDAFSQRLDIPRVEMMPSQPSPYEMRDWQQVAMGYDSLVFDLRRTGQYLPLIWLNPNTINYPNHDSFGLHSYVGTSAPGNAEAINILPAVIGATLVGIDKSDQAGMNWALRCEEFFNRRPEENVYLNGPVAQSGSDWWYDTMPNVFFYQLYDLYPGTGDFDYQFTTIADRWLQAVVAMGGSTTPWTRPNMNYRAWKLSTMTPNAVGVREPEAAGAIAWLLYHAFRTTGDKEYRIGAELAMEFLNTRTTNPSYELQLPYGAYAAARMNAELGTKYDLEKLVNWCFDVGPLRQWGVIVGNWGGYDCYGLVGEARGEGDYAFVMNGFEQAGALVPMVRYDDRFARAIGKWVLNLANASRLFYARFLPANNQDSEPWASQYDPHSYIAYEAMRRDWFGTSPFATGDAKGGGWAATNFALYGSSHVGILGGIIDTTEVEKILRLDTRKTDFFNDEAYPTYLYFNPYTETKSVNLNVGDGQHDVYDAVGNAFLMRNVSGITALTLPADEAVLAVVTPAGGTVTYVLDHLLIDGVIVDYSSGQAIADYPPRIKSLASENPLVMKGKSTILHCAAEDRDNDALSYAWSASGGEFSRGGAQITWTAPNTAGNHLITCVVDDGNGGRDSANVEITVIDNSAPIIISLTANPSIIDPGGSTRLICNAQDPDGDDLTYAWTATTGALQDSGAVAEWTAPEQSGYHYVSCKVEDGKGGLEIDSIGIVVGNLVGLYAFEGNAIDESGFNNHGMVSGATPVADRFGNPNSAYAFDGSDDFIRVPAHPSLNFESAVSINFWMTATELFDRESFPISHGSWQNRWKVSIIPEKKLRWTLKTTAGVVDLDSQALLVADSLYNVTVTYGNGDVRIYLNAVLNGSKNWSGKILQTSHDVTIGQMLPGDNQYNFRGVIDDVRIYNHVLSQKQIEELYGVATAVSENDDGTLPKSTALHPNYPNPFNPATTIRYDLSHGGQVDISVFNSVGQRVRTLVSGVEAPGSKAVRWDGRNEFGQPVASGVYVVQLKVGEMAQRRKLMLLK